jgi:hypothetical protein
MKTQPFRKLILITSVGVLLTTIGASRGLAVPESPPDFEPVPVDSLPPAGPIAGRTFAVVVAADDGFAYIGVESRLIVVDISNKNRPRAVGQTSELPDAIQDIYLAAGRIYAAAGEAGLRVIDIADPTTPLEVGSFDTPGHANGVHVDGIYAYVADGEAGLQLIDISNPAAPMMMATVDTDGEPSGVFVVGNYAYVAAGEGGLRVVDVSRPDAPLEVGVFYTLGDANDVYVTGTLAYLAAGGAGLRVIDVADPTALVELGAYEPQFARRVFVDGARAYLAAERNGLQVIDVSEADAPVPVRKHKTVGSAKGVFFASDYVYYADGVGGLVLDKKGSSGSPLFLPLTAKALPTP